MKGYFGQLARHTGLSFSNQTGVPGRVSTEPGVAAEAKTKAPVAPIHVEEVVFTASPPAVDTDVSARNTSVTVAAPQGKNQAASVVTQTEAFTPPLETVSPVADPQQQVSWDQAETSRHIVELPNRSLSQETAPHESQIQFVDPKPETAKPTTEQVFFDARPFDQSPLTVNAEPQSLTEETVTVESSAEELRQPEYETRDSSVRHHEVQSVEIVNSVESEREPRRIFQDQLKEVIAWITSPPEAVEQTALEVIEAQHETDTVVVREREQGRPAQRPTNNNEPHVNDLSLSIGTISIVVEEPKQDFPVPLTPVPTTHTSPQPVAPEPTRLSRYYLRNL